MTDAVENNVKTLEHENGMKYLLFSPAEPSGKKHPLILCLHGSGGVNNEEKVRDQGLVNKLLTEKTFAESFPFRVLAPIAEYRNWEVSFTKILAILDLVIEKHEIDTKRIYLTGYSLGAHGTWRMSSKFPSRFAAIAPIAGYLDMSNKKKIKNKKNGNKSNVGGTEIPEALAALKSKPIWVFHSADDEIIPVKFSDHMVKELQEAGNTCVKYTRYETAPSLGKFKGHLSHIPAYSTPELYEWMLKHEV